MKNTSCISWILASLFIHVAAGASLWHCVKSTPSPAGEEVLDLTLTVPPQGNLSAEPLPKTAKPSSLAPAAPSSSLAVNSETPQTVSSSETSDSQSDGTEGATGEAPVAWGEVTRLPKVKNEIKAAYPEEAKKARIAGPVVLDILIDNTGKVREVKVISGPGYGLNESAIEALKKFEFQPAQRGSAPVAVKIRYTYRFKLDVN